MVHMENTTEYQGSEEHSSKQATVCIFCSHQLVLGFVCMKLPKIYQTKLSRLFFLSSESLSFQ